jgi:gliding motility-associated lipoprotein GldJ
MKRTLIVLSVLCIGATTLLSSCSNKNKGIANHGATSPTTGWDYDDSQLGGYGVSKWTAGGDKDKPDELPPGTTFVEGGRFTMGMTEEDLTMERNNITRTVSVSSFYMDRTEVTNADYREYTYWSTRAYAADYPELVQRMLPDSTVWREAMAYNEPLVTYYFRHGAYDWYPVVGVNWNQANDYCAWRSDRVNEYMLMKRGMLQKNPNESGEDVYTNQTYTMQNEEAYQGLAGKNKIPDRDPTNQGRRNARYEDGFLLPNYRLPTEAEWEYAALGGIGNNPDQQNKRRRGEEVTTDRNIYPWGVKHTTRYEMRNEYQGQFLGNFKRGGGDVMGVAGALNDNADIPAPAISYEPNAFGLYNMAGNVSEWVMDTYRPYSHQDVADFRPFRGNQYKAVKRNADGTLEDKDSTGHLPMRDVTSDDVLQAGRYESKGGDVRNFRDGDSTSAGIFYDYGKNTLISDEAKVYKGASWADRAYWMSPGTRRYMQASMASSKVGFRCVMDRLGSPSGKNNERAGNFFNKKDKYIKQNKRGY